MLETIEQKCLSKGVKLTEQRKIIAKVLSESKAEYGESDHPDVDEDRLMVSEYPEVTCSHGQHIRRKGKIEFFVVLMFFRL